jgi:hypothetical protein
MDATATPIEIDAIAQTWEDVKLLVYKTVHLFIKRYGGDFDELVGESHMMYMRACEGYDGRSSFPTYVRWVVWHDLQELLRKAMRRNGKVVFGDIDPNQHGYHSTFDYAEFFDELSEDAKVVVGLVMDTPQELVNTMIARGGSPQTQRSVIRE